MAHSIHSVVSAERNWCRFRSGCAHRWLLAGARWWLRKIRSRGKRHLANDPWRQCKWLPDRDRLLGMILNRIL